MPHPTPPFPTDGERDRGAVTYPLPDGVLVERDIRVKMRDGVHLARALAQSILNSIAGADMTPVIWPWPHPVFAFPARSAFCGFARAPSCVGRARNTQRYATLCFCVWATQAYG